MNKKSIFGLIILIVLSLGCLIYYLMHREPVKITNSQKGWKTMEFRTHGYKIDYPESWTLRKPEKDYCFDRDIKGSGDQVIHETEVCVLMENNPKGLDYNDFFGLENLKDFDILPVKVGKEKMEGRNFVSIAGKSKEDTQYNLSTLLIAKNDKMYSINIISQKWNRDKNTVQEMLDSFILTK